MNNVTKGVNWKKYIPLFVLAGVMLFFQLVWIFSMLKCDILTRKYEEDFESAYQQNSMISDVIYFKVLSCDGQTARVYYVSKTNGDVLTFEKRDGEWIETYWETIWSTRGSASDFVWPYVHHPLFTGVLG